MAAPPVVGGAGTFLERTTLLAHLSLTDVITGHYSDNT